ncbi:MAG: hypothetical protein F6J93_17985 [Oscillatoria sp. SIO1A7]|nr:hypothetical protein [Oscillatoria sp. SIO1A7]
MPNYPRKGVGCRLWGINHFSQAIPSPFYRRARSPQPPLKSLFKGGWGDLALVNEQAFVGLVPEPPCI